MAMMSLWNYMDILDKALLLMIAVLIFLCVYWFLLRFHEVYMHDRLTEAQRGNIERLREVASNG